MPTGKGAKPGMATIWVGDLDGNMVHFEYDVPSVSVALSRAIILLQTPVEWNLTQTSARASRVVISYRWKDESHLDVYVIKHMRFPRPKTWAEWWASVKTWWRRTSSRPA